MAEEKRFILPSGQAVVLRLPEGGDRSVLVLLHRTPFGHRGSHPLPSLATSLKTATLRVDLTGCGDSEGDAQLVSHERDADDILACVRHLRKALGLEVGGLIGFGSGGTAALVYAARHGAGPDAVGLVVTVGARASPRGAASTLTWAQLERLRKEGTLVVEARDELGRARRVACDAQALDAPLALDGLGRCSRTHFLALHGSQDAAVPPSEAEALAPMLAGSASHEVRVVPGCGTDFAGHEPKLFYAISDWVWRRMMQPGAGVGAPPAVPPLGAKLPSGFNIFVESLQATIDEIHRDARKSLPSMDLEGGEDDSDGDDVVPILSARGPRSGPL